MAYQDHIIQMGQLIDSKKGPWAAIDAESVARMRVQNRFKTGLEIARYTAGIMRKDMAAYDADSSQYTQSLGCWHGFIAQQKLISVKKHFGGKTDRTYLYLSGWMIAALFLVLTAVTFSLLGFIIGIWADGFEKLQVVPMLIVTPLTFLGGSFYSIDMLPPVWRTISTISGSRATSPCSIAWRIRSRSAAELRSIASSSGSVGLPSRRSSPRFLPSSSALAE